MSRVVVLTFNLMDSSRVQSAVPDAVVARSLDAEALAGAEVILLDLTSGIDPADAVAIGPPGCSVWPSRRQRRTRRCCREGLSRGATSLENVPAPARPAGPHITAFMGSRKSDKRTPGRPFESSRNGWA